MQIVIEISEKDYKRIIKNDEDEQVQESCLCLLCRLSQAIKDGTPLPEHHGNLGDLDWLAKRIKAKPPIGDIGKIVLEECYQETLHSETIIPATKEEKSCENCKYQSFREAYSCVETPCNACYESSHFATKEGE